MKANLIERATVLKQVESHAECVLVGIHRLKLPGTFLDYMTAIKQVYVGNRRLLALDLTILSLMEQSLVLRLQEAIGICTTGSAIKWKPLDVRTALNDFMKSIEGTRGRFLNEHIFSKLPPSTQNAYRQFKHAEIALGKDLQDKAAWDWVKKNVGAAEDLPTFKSWTRYLRLARKALDERKNNPRRRPAPGKIRPRHKSKAD